MNAEDNDENNHRQVNKKLLHIPISPSNAPTDGIDDSIQGELTIPSSPPKPKALIIFAHGSDSGMDSPCSGTCHFLLIYQNTGIFQN